MDKSGLARIFHIYICKRRIFAGLQVNNKLKRLHMIEFKLTPQQASLVWAALLVAEDNALDNNNKWTANELRALRHELSRLREALREGV